MISTSGETSRAVDGAHELNDGRQSRRIDWRSGSDSPTASIIEIDVSLTDVIFGRYGNGLNGLGDRRRSSVVDCAIEGVVRAPASAYENDGLSDASLIYVSGYDESDRLDRGEDIDQRSLCYIATDRREDFAWATDIFIERRIVRRLVELYASKRIDSARISILLKKQRDRSAAIDLRTWSHPLLRTAGERRRRHSRAQLMSVQTSLSGATQARPAIVSHSTAWGARSGRRQDGVWQP